MALEDAVNEEASVAALVVTVRDEALFWRALLNVYRGLSCRRSSPKTRPRRRFFQREDAGDRCGGG